MTPGRTTVLCLSGLDPTGGAGIQADIESIGAAGGHALPLVTALTVQDSRNVAALQPVDLATLAHQLDVLLADCRIQAVKIGLLGNAAQTRFIASSVSSLGIPVVCDPVLRAGGGADLADHQSLEALRHSLLPGVTVLTPNASEARRLAGNTRDSAAAAMALLDLGCKNVLVTGGDEPDEAVVNVLYSSDSAPVRYEWPRLPETFHGAGCTLASAIAVRLAQGQSIEQAVLQAQVWTQGCLRRAWSVGAGRRIPDRLGGPPP